MDYVYSSLDDTLSFSIDDKIFKSRCVRMLSSHKRHTTYEYKLLSLNQDTLHEIKSISIKVMKKDSNVSHTLISEIYMLKLLMNLPNIIRMFCFRSTITNQCILVMESYECTLKEYIKKVPGPVRISHIKLLLEQMTEALGVVHNAKIIHRNVTCNTILVKNFESSGFLLCDFSTAIQLEPSSSLEYVCDGTRENLTHLTYKAPEVLCKLEYGSSVDIWSLGIVMLRFVLGLKRTKFGKMNNRKGVEGMLSFITVSSGFVEEILEEEKSPREDFLNSKELLMNYLDYIRYECAPVKELKLSPKNLYINIPSLRSKRARFYLNVPTLFECSKLVSHVEEKVISILSAMLTLSPIQRLSCDKIYSKLKDHSISLKSRILPLLPLTSFSNCLSIEIMLRIANVIYSTDDTIRKSLNLYNQYYTKTKDSTLVSCIACLLIVYKLDNRVNIYYVKIRMIINQVLEDKRLEYNSQPEVLNVLKEETFDVEVIKKCELNILSMEELWIF